MRRVDVAVIGAGTAGLAAYRAAVGAGRSALLIDGGLLGTTCARAGCMPSKLLIAAAKAAYAGAHARRFGVSYAAPKIDEVAVMERVRRERDRFVRFVVEGVERLGADALVRGWARFISPTILAVQPIGGGDTIEVHATAVVVATGSSPTRPPWASALGRRVLWSDDVFELAAIPRSLAVIGAGVIGLELGQALSRLGAHVHVFGRGGALGGLTDGAVRAAATGAMAQELALEPDTHDLEVTRVDDEVEVRWRDGSGSRSAARFERVLVAIGRTPNVSGLAPEQVGLPMLPGGRPEIDPETLQWGQSPIFVAGDAAGVRTLLHEAADEGRLAGLAAAQWPTRTNPTRRTPLSIVFSDPQIALVGARYAELADREFVTGAVDFADQGRARVMGRNRGRLHVYADPRTRRLLGAELVGPDAEHLAHLLAWVHQLGLTLNEILALPFYHPVVEEGLRTALRDALARCESRASVARATFAATKTEPHQTAPTPSCPRDSSPSRLARRVQDTTP